MDAKKKELLGDFKNGGVEWQPQGSPVPVRVHDVIDRELGKAIPYGVYDVLRNEGWVNVGVNCDTTEFAVESIRRWWRQMGRRAYPDATELLITADAGGSNGPRIRLWKTELQKLAKVTGLTLHVCHYPPGTSKWNKIEHRMFSHITQNWRGRPLESIETVINLIGSTTTTTGLRVRAGLDDNEYEKGVKVTDEELAAVNLIPDRARLPERARPGIEDRNRDRRAGGRLARNQGAESRGGKRGQDVATLSVAQNGDRFATKSGMLVLGRVPTRRKSEPTQVECGEKGRNTPARHADKACMSYARTMHFAWTSVDVHPPVPGAALLFPARHGV